jgi:hypothetical protein
MYSKAHFSSGFSSRKATSNALPIGTATQFAPARENAPAGNGPLDVFDPDSAKMSRPGPVQALHVPGTAWRLTKNHLL